MSFDNTYLFKKIDCLHKASEKAAERNRFYLFSTVFACIIICVGIYVNQYSWDEHLNEVERPFFGSKSLDLVEDENNKGGVDKKEKDVISQIYLDRQYINVPLLGFKFSVHDVNVIGSIGLCVLVTLSFFSNRREFWITHEVFETFIYVEKRITDSLIKSEDRLFLLEYIYHGCIQNYIFTTPTKDDYLAKGSLDPEDYKDANYKTNVYGRRFVLGLNFLPIIAITISHWNHIFSTNNGKPLYYEIFFRFAVLLVSAYYILYQTRISLSIFKASVKLQRYMFTVITDIQKSPEHS
jgi:hypothetical protein